MTEGYCLKDSREAAFWMVVSEERGQENDHGSCGFESQILFDVCGQIVIGS